MKRRQAKISGLEASPDVHDLVRAMQKLPYEARRRKFRRLVAGNVRFLYKYREFNPSDAHSVQIVRDVLVESNLWMASKDSFNDPFDMPPHIEIVGTASDANSYLSELAKREGLKRKAREELIARHRGRRAALVQAVQGSLAHHLSSAGVVSLSESRKSVLMWSHYARHHRGLCFAFEIARDLPNLAPFVPVDYNDSMPKVTWPKNQVETIGQCLRRKHPDWAYERERRRIVVGQANTKLRIRPDALYAVILGCRFGESEEVQLKALLEARRARGYPLPTIFRLHLSLSKFALMARREA